MIGNSDCYKTPCIDLKFLDFIINLSPLANARSSENLVLNGKKVRGGFDRSNWKQLNEDSFDKMFEYKRSLEEKFETMRALKHGTLEEKLAWKAEIQYEKQRMKEKQQNLQEQKSQKIVKRPSKDKNNQIPLFFH